MKKLLSLFASLAIVSTSASSVVSCGPTIDPNVLLLLPGDVMSSGSKVENAYISIVNDFNSTENPSVKVKTIWEPQNAVQQRSSSFQEVPDLYVENGDQTSMLAYDFQNGPNVRDMAKSAYPDLDEAAAQKKIDDGYWNSAFAELGKSASISDSTQRTLSLSLVKSFDLSVVNLKVVNEMLNIAGIDNADLAAIDKDEDTASMTKLFDDTAAKAKFKNDSSAVTIRTNFNALKQTKPVSKDSIRDFFKSDENVLALSTLYNHVYQDQMSTQSSTWVRQGITNNKRLFPIGIDDIPNKMMYEYADALKGQKIDIATAKKFLYTVDGIDPDKGKMNIKINNDDVADSGYYNSKYFFNKIEDLRFNKNDTDKLQAWAGSLAIGKIDGKTYTSNYFNQGSMMEASSSSAGTWAFKYSASDYATKKPWPDAKSNAFNNAKDLVTVGGASGSGQSYNFVSQGPQLAGYKSVGSNKAEKEKTVTKFLQYLLEPKVQTKLAILSGYIPADKSALSEYMPFIDGDKNVTKPSWMPSYGAADPILSDFLHTYSGYQKTTGSAISPEEQNYVNDANMISVQPNPAGGMIRNAIGDIMLNYVLVNHATFADMFKQAKAEDSIAYYITNNELPDAFNDSKVTYTNN